MTTCPHCHGRGVIHVEPVRRGNALGKLPPFGRDVEQAMREKGSLIPSVWLLYRAEDPARPARVAFDDPWQAAAKANQSLPGSCMVLTDGADVRSFRWPAIAVMEGLPQVVFWAFACTEAEYSKIATDLLAVGYEWVKVYPWPHEPIDFRAVPSWAA